MKGHVVPTLVHPCLHSSLQVDFSRPGAQQSGGVTISQFGIGHSLVHGYYTKVHLIPTSVQTFMFSLRQGDFFGPGTQQPCRVTISEFGIGHSLIHR